MVANGKYLIEIYTVSGSNVNQRNAHTGREMVDGPRAGSPCRFSPCLLHLTIPAGAERDVSTAPMPWPCPQAPRAHSSSSRATSLQLPPGPPPGTLFSRLLELDRLGYPCRTGSCPGLWNTRAPPAPLQAPFLHTAHFCHAHQTADGVTEFADCLPAPSPDEPAGFLDVP